MRKAMNRATGYYDVAVAADCDTPAKVLAMLSGCYQPRDHERGDDEGVQRIRFCAAAPFQDVRPLFNILNGGFVAAGLENGEATIGTVRKGRGDAVILTSPELGWTLRKISVALNRQACQPRA